MLFFSERHLLPAECQNTANFLYMFDKLFDSFNGHSYSGTSKEFLGPLKHGSPHIKLWREINPVLKSIKFKTITTSTDGTQRVKCEKVPSITNWSSNLNTF